MSETLSAEELAQLKANHGEGKPCAGMCLESKAVATIEALQAEVTTLRTALERIAQSAKALRYASIEDKALEALHGRE